MIGRLILFPIASVLVGALVLGVVGFSPALFQRSHPAANVQPSSELSAAAKDAAMAQLAKLGVTRHDLRHALRSGRGDVRAMAQKLGLGGDAVRRVADAAGIGGAVAPIASIPHGRVVGLAWLGLLAAGMVGAPFVALGNWLLRALFRRRRQPMAAFRA